MKLFLVRRQHEGGYDTFDSFVCTAKNEAAARLVHPYGADLKWTGTVWQRRYASPSDYVSNDDTWAPPDTLIVEHIGTAKNGIDGVICASFNAG